MLYGYRQLHCSCENENTCKAIAEDVETRFDASKCELDRSLPKGKNKKLIGLMNWSWIRWKNYERICWTKSKNIAI